jgi:hypothetical protein
LNVSGILDSITTQNRMNRLQQYREMRAGGNIHGLEDDTWIFVSLPDASVVEVMVHKSPPGTHVLHCALLVNKGTNWTVCGSDRLDGK